MNYRLLAYTALAAMIGGGFLFLSPVTSSLKPVPQSSQPGKPFSDIVVRGRLEPIDGVLKISAFSPSASPTLGKLFVDTGDRVEAGQILAELGDAQALQAEVAAARMQVELAKRRLEQARHPYREGTLAAMRAAVEARRVDVSLAEDEVRRTGALGDVRSEAERVRYNAALARAQSDLNAAEANLAAVTDVSPTEVAVVEAEVSLAEANLKAKQAQAELSLIRAPQKGQVIRVELRPGEPLAAAPVLQLADMDRVKVVAEVDERLIERIKIGGQAEVRVRGGNQSVAAEVTKIGTLVMATDRLPLDAATGRGGRFVEVDLAPDAASALPTVAGLELQVTFKMSPAKK